MEEEDSGLGYKPQKQVIYNKLLPYSEEIREEIIEQFSNIKINLAKAVVLRDIRPGCVHWVAKLSRFVNLYGICISKEDHIYMVKLLYELSVNPQQEYWVTAKFAQMLTILLKKRELLAPDDLVLNWRPLYELYESLFYNSYYTIGMLMLPARTRRPASRFFRRRKGETSSFECVIKSMIRVCRTYFPPGATSEILEQVRPMICPFDMTMQRAMMYLELFLPTSVEPHEADISWKLWKDEMLGIWNACHNSHFSFWENGMFWLFARLAWHNIGYVEWEEHLSMVFTKVLRSFHLPVTYKKTHVGRGDGLDRFASSMFIVANLGGGSKTQQHLERLFKSLESYYHPSNSGPWTRHLHEFLNKLTLLFIRRLHRERYMKPSWELGIEPKKKLTEEEITAFVRCVQTPAMLAMFSHTGTHDAGVVFHRLSLLRPEIVIPPLLEQLYSSLETTTEPHRLTASLECVVCVARAMVKGGKYYPEGQRHVIPLLLQTLPGIDPNDIKKCMVTFQFIYTLVTLVPFVDCSSAIDEASDLTEIEQEVCLQTASFEDFVLQFMDRCFVLIENSALEQITQLDRETEKMNREENMLEMGLSSTFSAILTQAHPSIYQAALQRLQSFIKGKMIEIHVAGKFAANMCRSAVKVNPQEALKVFVPSVCRLLITLTSNEEVQKEENLDDELLFNLLLLSELVRCSGMHLVEYVPQITQVLTLTLHLKSREGYHLSGSILRYLLKYLGITIPSEYRSMPHKWDVPLSEFFPIRHWGEAGDIHNLGLNWIEPGEPEEKAMTTLVRTFLVPELVLLRQVAKGEKEVAREVLHQSLSIVLDILLGAGVALPHWEEDPLTLVEMAVKKDNSKFITGERVLRVELDTEDLPTNVRKAVADVILELVDRLLNQVPDDTKSLSRAINIYHGLIFFHGVSKDDFDARWKSFQFIKDALANKLARNKQHIRSLLVERAVLQQESRMLENSTLHFTATHKAIMSNLLHLSTSHYSEVRSKAQNILNQLFQYFPYSYKLILPDLVTYLKVDPTENHEQFKGSLYLLLGRQSKPLVVRRDWESLNMMWPALIATKHSEKPSIIRLFNALSDAVYYHMELFAVYHHISDSLVKTAENVLETHSGRGAENKVVPEAAVAKACQDLVQRGESNHQRYTELVSKLVTLLETGNLHWRTHNMTINLLGALVRPDIPFPAVGVRAFTSSLIHDNIRIRETSMFFMPWILKNQKRPHKKIEIDPYSVGGKNEIPPMLMPGDSRPDNAWMQFDSSKRITTEEEWEQPRFVEKTFHGWYTWPKKLKVYAPASQQPNLDREREELKEEEKEIYDFFSSKEKVDKLISFLSLEENKERDSFNTRRFWMFKGLFRNFGSTFIEQFRGHLEKLVGETQKSSQRCAVEILTGMIRGSKHWTFAKHQALWEMLKPIIQTGMAKVTVETVEDWGTCMATSSADRDPNRLAPLMDILLDDPLRASEGAFNGSSRMYMLMGGLGQQEWRVAELSHRLLEYLRPYLSHPYKSIRDRIGSVLTGIFMFDLVLPGGVPSRYPSCADFIEYLLPQLSILIQDSGSSMMQDMEVEGVSCDPALPSSQDIPSPPQSSLAIFTEDVIAPMMGLAGSSLGASDSLNKVLASVHKVGPTQISAVDQFVNLPSLDSASLLSGRLDKDALRVVAKHKLRDNCDISGDVICQPMEVIPTLSVELKNHVHKNHIKSQANGFVRGNEERKTAVRLMNTVCRWLVGQMGRCYNGVTPEIYRFLPYLCQLESVDNDPELRGNCVATLAIISQSMVLPHRIAAFMEAITQVAHSSWWRARAAVLSLLQVAVFTNMFTILTNEEATLQIPKLVVDLLADVRLEVRQMASTVLSGLIHCKFIQAEDKLLGEFTSRLQSGQKRKRRRKEPLSPQQILELHAGILGLCAYVSAFPYDVPDMMPEVLVTLSEHLNDPHPIPATIKKTLSNFRRTHHDNWRDHKQKFTEDQLVVLTDLLLSPSYYA
ncbi:proteasome activator complex subunit 4-like isoform X1 [Penaeus chinensis]|uniref:proteasome activator complex subunit 4-like isoform X1 n=1 Tax=Penaeus chinensis TaxID=139456 RepID=UPI001FB8238B|nr:proteasome activator complex subunit 4-like isoform X1 [Penaeus chinensis]